MDVKIVDYAEKNAPALFAHSLKETGFAVIKNHPIKKDVIDSIYQAWTTFFSSDDKHNYKVANLKEQAGFYPMEMAESPKGQTQRDLKEYYHYYLWGKNPAWINQETTAIYQQLTQLASTLLTWIEEQAPNEVAKKFSEPLSDMITDSHRSLLRILHYPPIDGEVEPGAIRAAEHGDINLLTVLITATDSGLQVKDVKGKWHDVPCDYGTIAVNVGDMLEMASQGYYQSTPHRVINPKGAAAKRSRLSMPLFLHPRDSVRLSDTHTAHEFLQQRIRELGY